MTTGLVAGRFLPPHAGHQWLMATAGALVDRLVILLRVAAGDPIPAELRLGWLAELFPRAVLVRCDERPSTRWPELAGRALVGDVGAIDLMFAGGAGNEDELGLAALLGARTVPLDPHRSAVPVTSARLRADPLGLWRYLPAPVRPYHARTICLHGPESTGKSTLAPVLARHFETMWLPEYGRTYCETFGLELTMADLLAIGRTHAAMTQAAKPLCNGRLILDTDPLMTAAWAEMLFDRSDPWFDGFEDTADLYLLLDLDIPWVDDGTRFFGGETQRRRFFQCSRDQLDRRGLAYALIGGPAEERLERSIAAIAAAGLG